MDVLRPYKGMKRHGRGHGWGQGSTALSNAGRNMHSTRMGMDMGIKGWGHLEAQVVTSQKEAFMGTVIMWGLWHP